VAERTVPRGNVEPVDRLLEALIELAQSAIANRREATERRAKMHVVDGGRRGRAA
jgi:hypothetical protein